MDKKKLLQQLTKKYQPGDVLFREGDMSRELYILLQGTIEIRRGNTTIAKLTEPDTYLGEMSTLLGAPRTATAVAAIEVLAVCIPQTKVLDFFEFSPNLGMKLARMLAQRLQQMNDKYQSLLEEVEKGSAHTAQFARLVQDADHRYFLPIYLQMIGSEMPMRDLTTMISISAERLQKVLMTYRGMGLVKISGMKIEFIEPDDDNLKRQIYEWRPI